MAVAEGTAVTDIEHFVGQDGREEQVARVKELIALEKVEYVYYQFASVTGRIMGKGVPAKHWESMAEKGFQLVYGSTANLFVDRHGNYIGYGPEAAELVGIPEPDTFAVLPWDRRVARVWCTCFRNREERDDPGGFLTSDCRGNLNRIQAAFEAETGLHLRAGTEPEMMWLKLKEDGTPDVQGLTKPFCYHIDQFSELQPVIHKVVEYGQALGLDMIQGDHEDAPGQIELNFGFDRAEKTADNLSTFRQICKQVGRELGVFPCFMPKPFMGVSGNGCHHNISLWKESDNSFMPDSDDPQRPSQLGLWAGLRRLGLPEPHDRAPRVGSRPFRVPQRGLGGEPVPLAGGPHRRDEGRDRPQARSGRARGAEHLRGDGGRQAGAEDSDDVRRRPRRAREGRGRPVRAARRHVSRLHALQA
jgi:hypothetical protein